MRNKTQVPGGENQGFEKTATKTEPHWFLMRWSLWGWEDESLHRLSLLTIGLITVHYNKAPAQHINPPGVLHCWSQGWEPPQLPDYLAHQGQAFCPRTQQRSQSRCQNADIQIRSTIMGVKLRIYLKTKGWKSRTSKKKKRSYAKLCAYTFMFHLSDTPALKIRNSESRSAQMIKRLYNSNCSTTD